VLAREAHTLGSTCQSFGLPAIAEILRQIEAKAKTGITVDQLDGLSEIEAELTSGLQSLPAIIRDLTG
jgi:HPt (histidine-containing phosphotransfer) domain-containing protein